MLQCPYMHMVSEYNSMKWPAKFRGKPLGFPLPLDHILYILTFEVQLLSQKYFSVNFGFYPDTS